jgi:hypothetical protein
MTPAAPGKAGRFRGVSAVRPAYLPLHYLIAALPCRAGRQAGAALGNHSPGPCRAKEA